jgi:hypothetical protein
MKNGTDKTPTEPGFYWLAEDGMPPHRVKVDVESDSHGMFFVRLPDDDHKYPFDMRPVARWLGPITKMQ